METVEQQIQRVGATKGPRITPEHIESLITAEAYAMGNETNVQTMFESPAEAQRALGALDLLTLCVLVLQNGYTIVGKSACASPENFNAEVGKRIAREDAVRQIWALEGYALRTSLMLGGNA